MRQRGRAVITAMVALGLLASASGSAHAWRFGDDSRPVKVIAMGGSSTAYPRGNYGQFLAAACPRIEVVNLAEASLSITGLKDRFVSKVLQNPALDTRGHETWLLVRGGLNSIYNPENVNRILREIFSRASKRGIKTVALSLSPWGDKDDRGRWWGSAGLKAWRDTAKTVDYLLGRIDPADALGRYARTPQWQPGDLPDIAVDLFDSPLRTRAADPYDVAALRPALAEETWVKRELARVRPTERTTALDAMAARAADIPRWHLREELHAFDHTHPNTEGHRIIASLTCPRLPASWGCDCQRIAQLTWRGNALVPAVRSADAR